MDEPIKKMRRRVVPVGGIILIIIGVLILLDNLLDISFGNLFLMAIGGVFLLAALLSREGGLLIPGGILAGIGTGIFLLEGPLKGLEEPQDGGVFLLAFAAGWLVISLLSLALRPVQVWPLIPGGILGLIGAALFIGGPALDVLETAGRFWPVALILLGLWVMFVRSKKE